MLTIDIYVIDHADQFSGKTGKSFIASYFFKNDIMNESQIKKYIF